MANVRSKKRLLASLHSCLGKERGVQGVNDSCEGCAFAKSGSSCKEEFLPDNNRPASSTERR